MDLYVLFGQRMENYPGQTAPEALAVMDEWSREQNPDWIREQKEKYDGQSDIAATRIARVSLDHDEDELRDLMFEAPTVNGSVNPDP